jgi:hypothetical protein
LRLN